MSRWDRFTLVHFRLPVLRRLWLKMGMRQPAPEPVATQLLAHFQAIPDPRFWPAQRHELLSILMISDCAVLFGADSFTDIALWGALSARLA